MILGNLSYKVATKIIDNLQSTQNLSLTDNELCSPNTHDILFKDSYFIYRFVDVFFDVIRKTHVSLSYMMACKINDCDIVKQNILNTFSDSSPNSINVCSIKQCLTNKFVSDFVYTIILPLFKKYRIFSFVLMDSLLLKCMLYFIEDIVPSMKGDQITACHVTLTPINVTTTLLNIDSDNCIFYDENICKLLNHELEIWSEQQIKYVKPKVMVSMQ